MKLKMCVMSLDKNEATGYSGFLHMNVRDDGVRNVGTMNKRLRGRDSTSHLIGSY